MFGNLPQFPKLQRSILARLYFVFCQKLGVASDVNEEVEGSSYPEDNCGPQSYPPNVKEMFIFSKCIQEPVPRFGPWIPRVTSQQELDRPQQRNKSEYYFEEDKLHLQSNAVQANHVTKEVNDVETGLNQDVASPRKSFFL